jgi:hypothetical protein
MPQEPDRRAQREGVRRIREALHEKFVEPLCELVEGSILPPKSIERLKLAIHRYEASDLDNLVEAHTHGDDDPGAIFEITAHDLGEEAVAMPPGPERDRALAHAQRFWDEGVQAFEEGDTPA